MLTEKKIGSGLVFGKFMPLHLGHVLLLRFAEQSCHRLTIVVCSVASEPIPGHVRFQWVKQLFPKANVINHCAELPQEPSDDCPEFWNLWKESLERHCPGEEFEALFGSEDYGWKMAEVMGISYIPVNRTRNLVPVSGTAIRNNPLRYWQYLPNVVRAYFVKRVAIVGPESSGKTTLARILADRLATVHVDEYARRLLEEYVKNRGYAPGEVRRDDIATIARGQIATEDALIEQATRVIITDTELLTTVYWSKYYFGACPSWVEHEAGRRGYDLYLLLSPEMPWIADAQRPMPDIEERRRFFSWWQEELKRRGRRFVVVDALSWEGRLEQAEKAVRTLLAS